MNRKAILIVAMVALVAPTMAFAQNQHRRIPAQTVGHPLLHHGAAGCGCATPAPKYVAAHGCNSCRPCCPPIIPAILNGVDRLVSCLLPCKRLGCGGCGSCRTYNGCGVPGCNGGCGGGVIVNEGVIIDSKPAPAAATPAQNTYYNRRGTLTPRYQQTRLRPAPARRISTPKPAARPANKPAPRTPTVSNQLQRVESENVKLKPANESRVRTVGFEEKVSKRIPNPLRD